MAKSKTEEREEVDIIMYMHESLIEMTWVICSGERENVDGMKYENTWALLTLQRWEEGVKRENEATENCYLREAMPCGLFRSKSSRLGTQ